MKLEIERASLHRQLDEARENDKNLLQRSSDLKQEHSYPWKSHADTTPRERGAPERFIVSFASGSVKDFSTMGETDISRGPASLSP
jgi:hypothetical protein